MTFRLESISAFTQIGDDDEEGIIAIDVGGGQWMPLIMADEARLVTMRPFAQSTARLTGQPVRLLRFTGPVEVVEVIEPLPRQTEEARMSGDEVLGDPEFKAWANHVRGHVMPMMQDSPLVISLIPKTDADIKFAVELGLAIMLDKPLVCVVAPGQIIAGKLRQVADQIIEWEPGMSGTALHAAMVAMGIPAPVCPGCNAVAESTETGWRTVHADDCTWLADPGSEPYDGSG